MEISYSYTRKRSEFGRPCAFSDRPAEITVDIPPDPSMASDFILRNPVDTAVQHTCDMSEHEVRATHPRDPPGSLLRRAAPYKRDKSELSPIGLGVSSLSPLPRSTRSEWR